MTIFAYGQTGSGKTYTMLEGFDSPDVFHDSLLPQTVGVAPRLMRDIFSAISGAGAPGAALVSARVRVTCLEIYNENVFDLLAAEGPNAREAKSVVIRDNEMGEAVVSGLEIVTVTTPAELSACLARGMNARAVGATAMNARSSRSHMVFTIQLEQVRAVGGGGGRQ